MNAPPLGLIVTTPLAGNFGTAPVNLSAGRFTNTPPLLLRSSAPNISVVLLLQARIASSCVTTTSRSSEQLTLPTTSRLGPSLPCCFWPVMLLLNVSFQLVTSLTTLASVAASRTWRYGSLVLVLKRSTATGTGAAAAPATRATDGSVTSVPTKPRVALTSCASGALSSNELIIWPCA